MQGSPVLAAVAAAFSVYRFILIAQVLTSWFPAQNRRHPVFKFIDDVTDPVLNPVRRALPAMGGVDFSPVLVFFVLQFIEGIVLNILRSFGL